MYAFFTFLFHIAQVIQPPEAVVTTPAEVSSQSSVTPTETDVGIEFVIQEPKASFRVPTKWFESQNECPGDDVSIRLFSPHAKSADAGTGKPNTTDYLIARFLGANDASIAIRYEHLNLSVFAIPQKADMFSDQNRDILMQQIRESIAKYPHRLSAPFPFGDVEVKRNLDKEQLSFSIAYQNCGAPIRVEIFQIGRGNWSLGFVFSYQVLEDNPAVFQPRKAIDFIVDSIKWTQP